MKRIIAILVFALVVNAFPIIKPMGGRCPMPLCGEL